MEDAPNCLVLDEPTNHLDIDSIEVLEDALEHYDGTVIAVSHDRYFLDRIADRIVRRRRRRGARLRGRLVGERDPGGRVGTGAGQPPACRMAARIASIPAGFST